MNPQPLRHLIEPHERAMVEEPYVEPSPLRGWVFVAVFVGCLAFWVGVIWMVMG